MSLNSSDDVPLANITVNKYAYSEVVETLNVRQPGSSVIEIAILCILVGILTVLASTAVHILVRKGLDRWSIKTLLGCTVLLCASTWTYGGLQVASIVNVQNELRFLAANIRSTTLPTGAGVNQSYTDRLNTASTVMLIINMMVGDGIVWWRACVIWPGNLAVRSLCILMLLATFATSVASLVPNAAQGPTAYLENKFGTATMALSLATNIAATALIAFKAWQHWRLLRVHLGRGKSAIRVLKVLALLVESGIIYTALLVLIMAWQTLVSTVQSSGQKLNYSPAVWALAYLLIGCLVPLIAIYPTLIIVLVYLEHSTLENGIYNKPPSSIPSAHHPISSHQMTETAVSHKYDGDTGTSRLWKSGLSISEPTSRDIEEGPESTQNPNAVPLRVLEPSEERGHNSLFNAS